MPQKLAVCGSLVKPLAPGLRQIDLPDRGGPPLGTVSKLEAGLTYRTVRVGVEWYESWRASPEVVRALEEKP